MQSLFFKNKADSSSVLFLCSAFNGLSQKIWTHFASYFRESKLMVGLRPQLIHQLKPDFILCPYLIEYLPPEIHETYPCLVVHPGPPDDGGPSSLNWAVLHGESVWGISIFQADAQWDSGKLWGTQPFALPPNTSVSSIYRGVVADIVLTIMPETLERFFKNNAQLPRPPLNYRPCIGQSDLAFEWDQETEIILRKINAGDSSPGTVGVLEGREYRLFGVRTGDVRGESGKVLRAYHGEICVGTGDGSLWIARMAQLDGVKICAAEALQQED